MQVDPLRLEYQADFSVHGLNIVLLQALCIKVHRNFQMKELKIFWRGA